MRLIVTTSLVLGLAACGPTFLAPEEASPDQNMIFHGSTVDQAYHDATVSLHRAVGGGGVTGSFCSGTLIFDRWVLTAAHCVTDLTFANDLLVKFGEDGNRVDPADLYDVRQVIVHPGYDDRFLQDDLALVELTQTPSHATPVPPLPAGEGLTDADEGRLIDLAGFGFQEDGGFGELLHVRVPIFDVRAQEIEYDQGSGFGSGSGGACNGDSGGPAYFDRGGRTYLAGVTSYGDFACTDYGVSVKVDAYTSWIEGVTGIDVDSATAPGTGGDPQNPPGTATLVNYTGAVDQGFIQYFTYEAAGRGVHHISLDGAPGSDMDVYLMHFNARGNWVVAGVAETPFADESLVVDVPSSGTFAVGVYAYSGGGAYSVELLYPN